VSQHLFGQVWWNLVLSSPSMCTKPDNEFNVLFHGLNRVILMRTKSTRPIEKLTYAPVSNISNKVHACASVCVCV
jgi:hypothetical protein